MVFEINAYGINKDALYDLNTSEIITNGKTILYELYDTETNKEIGSLQFRTYLTEYGGGNEVDNLIALCRNCHGKKTASENM